MSPALEPAKVEGVNQVVRQRVIGVVAYVGNARESVVRVASGEISRDRLCLKSDSGIGADKKKNQVSNSVLSKKIDIPPAFVYLL